MLDKKGKEFAMCEECGLIENLIWVEKDRHVCGKITDPDFIPLQNMKLRIGKKKFVSIIYKNNADQNL